MALRGNLRDITFTQILNLINLAKKTGILIVEGPGETAQVSFREGKLVFAQIEREESNLAIVLNKAKKLTANQYRTIMQYGSTISDKELGLMLINAGYISKEDILLSIQQHCMDIAHRMFTWMEGFFRFENDMLSPDNRITIRLDLENLIIEGSRQMREWEQLQDEIPSLDMALKFADRPGADFKNINLSVEEWRVVSYINPKNSLHQIAHVTKMNDLEIRRIIYGLLQAGLVEIIRPSGQVAAGKIRSFPTKNKEEQKSLVNRLINRIRSL
ncbi:MAG: DUF4388 domain-containing protein [Chloroflexota bacterium]